MCMSILLNKPHSFVFIVSILPVLVRFASLHSRRHCCLRNLGNVASTLPSIVQRARIFGTDADFLIGCRETPSCVIRSPLIDSWLCVFDRNNQSESLLS